MPLKRAKNYPSDFALKTVGTCSCKFQRHDPSSMNCTCGTSIVCCAFRTTKHLSCTTTGASTTVPRTAPGESPVFCTVCAVSPVSVKQLK